PGSVALYPHAEITAVSAEAATIRLTDRGGGIGPVQVLVNGTEILADARGAGDPASGAEIRVDLGAAQRFLVPGMNTLEVVVSSADGSLRSRRIRAPFEVADLRGQGPEGRPPEAYTPHLWAVVVGTSDYLDDALDLSFAAKDAVDIAAALRIAGGRLLSPERTHVTVLSTESDDTARWPTRERVLATLDSVAALADPRDVLVVYLAGHGIVGGDDGYTYLTHVAVSPEASGDAPGALTSATLTEALKQVPALKRVLILDTCASGDLVDDLSVVRATDGDQTRSLDRLKDRTGTFILAGSTADRPSYEASQYAQGLLTWSLLDGMRGAALRDGGEVDVVRLFGHALDTVPALARGVGGVQAPTMVMPAGGGSFPIG
ncbi:MAG: caspase family protein, partial [Bacteroidota bacterium]